LPGPKIISTITSIKTSSQGPKFPIKPNIEILPFSHYAKTTYFYVPPNIRRSCAILVIGN
jgi:hypothetical protein